MTEKLVEVTHLKKYFHAGRPNEVRAVDDVSFTIHRGEVFGLVGESGSGKTTVGGVLNLYHPTAVDHFAGDDGFNVAPSAKRISPAHANDLSRSLRLTGPPADRERNRGGRLRSSRPGDQPKGAHGARG